LADGALRWSLAQGVCQQSNRASAQQQQSSNRQRIWRRRRLRGRLVVAGSVGHAGRSRLIRARRLCRANPRGNRFYARNNPAWNVARAESRHDRRVQNLAYDCVGQNCFHAVARFDLHAPVAQRDQHQHAVVRTALAYTPAVEQFRSVLFGGCALRASQNNDGDFRASVALQLVDQSVQPRFVFGRQHARHVRHPAPIRRTRVRHTVNRLPPAQQRVYSKKHAQRPASPQVSHPYLTSAPKSHSRRANEYTSTASISRPTRG